MRIMDTRTGRARREGGHLPRAFILFSSRPQGSARGDERDDWGRVSVRYAVSL